jgi:hypothetical protein
MDVLETIQATGKVLQGLSRRVGVDISILWLIKAQYAFTKCVSKQQTPVACITLLDCG